MPREQITDTMMTEHWDIKATNGSPGGVAEQPYAGSTGPMDPTHWVEFKPELHIAWNPGNWVQAQLDIDTKQLLRRAAELNARIENGEDVGSQQSFTTDVLDRRHLQNLVRTTRRARNAVFGGDE